MIKFIIDKQSKALCVVAYHFRYVDIRRGSTRYENTKIADIIVKYSFYPINSIKVIMLRPPSILERGPG